MERKPVLGIFLGEAAGIGPELVAKVVADGTGIICFARK